MRGAFLKNSDERSLFDLEIKMECSDEGSLFGHAWKYLLLKVQVNWLQLG